MMIKEEEEITWGWLAYQFTNCRLHKKTHTEVPQIESK